MRAQIHVFIALVLASSACLRDEQPARPTHVAVTVSALDLPGIDDARWTVTVANGDGQTVWSKSGLSSQRYGDGAGGLSYVGPCDAEANPNTIELVLEGLSSAGAQIDPATYRNPTPVSLGVQCRENSDVPVVFNLVVLRDARQGFFDVAVNFEDTFCSAKLDCVDALLHDPVSGLRTPTVVLAFACTSGQEQPTFLYLDDVQVACAGGPTYTFDPSQGVGNVGGAAPMFAQVAIYQGAESLPGLDKCYWNLALGLDVSELGASCTLSATGTAADHALDGGQTPAETIYPLITWQAPLTNADRQLICGQHALNAADGVVSTGYTDFEGRALGHGHACGALPEVVVKQCEGQVAGLSDEVSFTIGPDGLRVQAGAATSPTYRLAANRKIGGCCIDPCCDGGP